jgi:hypothetical protein
LKAWNRRWFKLEANKLSYNRSGEKAEKETGMVLIDSNATISPFEGRPNSFTVETPTKQFNLSANNTEDYEKWFNALTGVATAASAAPVEVATE